jgi:hypothetical protein
MSLTSYRAAPPRVNRMGEWGVANSDWTRDPFAIGYSPFAAAARPRHHEEGIVLGWPGDDLLSRVLRHSTIGAEAFNGRVRDGIGFRRLAQVTGPAKDNLFWPQTPACTSVRLASPRISAGAHLRLRTFGPGAPAVRPASKHMVFRYVVHGHGP